MDRPSSLISASAFLWSILLLYNLSKVLGNGEGHALNALRTQLADPNNVLQSWDPTLVNPCTWLHVTCNSDNSVTRVDLGNANLSGQLVSQLGQLTNLQYLELYSNNITGRIPYELGNLTNLVSLDLYRNRLEGVIPDTLGKLQKLRFLYEFTSFGFSFPQPMKKKSFFFSFVHLLLHVNCLLLWWLADYRCGCLGNHGVCCLRKDSRLNNNTLTGTIPNLLTTINSLQVLDLSNNHLSGDVPVNGSFSAFTPISFANNPNLRAPAVTPQPPAPPNSHSSSVGNSATGAIAGGVYFKP